MNVNEVASMKSVFDQYKHIDQNGNEYWNARDLCSLMGYGEFRKFKSAIDRAKSQMINTGRNPDDHIAQSAGMVTIGSGASRMVEDYQLNKYAAYTIAMNADPSKPEVAFAQQYFLQCTATVEALYDRMKTAYMIRARDSLKERSKHFTAGMLERDVSQKEVGKVLSKGDEGFFDMTTKEFKEYAGIPANKPTYDVLGMMSPLKETALTLAEYRMVKDDAYGVEDISNINYEENRATREFIQQRTGESPENLIGDDIIKIKSKYNKDTKKLEKDLKDNE